MTQPLEATLPAFGPWATAFYEQYRTARAAALRNAEDFHDLLYATERLGYFLTNGKENTLGRSRGHVVALAGRSPLAVITGASDPCHIPVQTLHEMVTEARNDALHQGAWARHLTTHATELALILEDALMSGARLVRDFMVRGPTCAELWQQLATIRQLMLTYSYSSLPVLRSDRWSLVTDRGLAAYLREVQDERKERLGQTLELAVQAKPDLLMQAETVTPEIPVKEAVSRTSGGLLLVVHPDDPKCLLGVVSAFDLI